MEDLGKTSKVVLPLSIGEPDLQGNIWQSVLEKEALQTRKSIKGSRKMESRASYGESSKCVLQNLGGRY